LGADGFGFAPTKEGLEKIPQRGKVVLEDEVEVGALTTIDRATFEETRIRKGSKLDSHVHVGHNVDLGERSMLSAFTGIAGSTKIGKGFIAAGQAGVGPGLEIGDHIVVGAQAGLVTSESEPGEYFGMPASRGKHWHKQMLALKQLPELLKTVKKLEHQINALRSSHT
jgi:UDP-3-O-[3-hydroxymyristoyl] glucosamine N-acyltransferase